MLLEGLHIKEEMCLLKTSHLTHVAFVLFILKEPCNKSSTTTILDGLISRIDHINEDVSDYSTLLLVNICCFLGVSSDSAPFFCSSSYTITYGH